MYMTFAFAISDLYFQLWLFIEVILDCEENVLANVISFKHYGNYESF